MQAELPVCYRSDKNWIISYWIRENQKFPPPPPPYTSELLQLVRWQKQKIKPQGSILRVWEPKINVNLKIVEKPLHKPHKWSYEVWSF